MTVKYADRAFITVNGAFLSDLQSASLRQTMNARVSQSITPDGFNRGATNGNRDIDITLAFAVPNVAPRVAFEAINYASNDVQITWICGGQIAIATGVYLKDVEDSAPGVGEEVKTTASFGAMRVTDAIGNPVLFNLDLG